MTAYDADAVDALLPQTQCRRCGFDGCRPYAQAIAAGTADIDRCPPGGDAGVARLAALVGRAPPPLDRTRGEPKPLALAAIDESICIGCTLCIQACPVDAIVGGAKRLHAVVASLCTGCELCLPPCPVDCIELVPATFAWDDAHADAARARHRARDERLARTRTAPPPTVDDATRRRRAIVAAAVERRAGAGGAPPRRVEGRTRHGAMKPADRETFFARLAEANPDPASELTYGSPYELLVAVILSAQATDLSVNKATERLFPVANTPQAMVGARRRRARAVHPHDRPVSARRRRTSSR